MPDLERLRSPTMLDVVFQTVFRLGFPVARAWWELWHPPHEGSLVAIYLNESLLLVRSSYRVEWNLPGGGIKRGETPQEAARRELAEELSLNPSTPLQPVGFARGIWDGRKDRVHFFELRLDQRPALRLDNREIIGLKFVSPAELRDLPLTGPIVEYLAGRLSPAVEY